VLCNPVDPPAATALKETQAAARGMNVEFVQAEARSFEDFARAFEAIAQAHPQALVILNSPLMSIHVARLAEIALALKLPSIFTDSPYPRAGGLMSYGPDFSAVTRQAAHYFDRIFRGEKPSGLPIEQPTRFELVINLKTARTLGLTIPEPLLATADEVIE